MVNECIFVHRENYGDAVNITNLNPYTKYYIRIHPVNTTDGNVIELFEMPEPSPYVFTYSVSSNGVIAYTHCRGPYGEATCPGLPPPPPAPSPPHLPLPPLPSPPRLPPPASPEDNFFQTSAALIGGQPTASVLILTPSYQLVKDGGPLAYSISSVRQDCSTTVNSCTWTVVESYTGNYVSLTMNTNDYVWVLPYDVSAGKNLYAFTPPPFGAVYGEYQFTGLAMQGLRTKISATPPVEGYSA